MKKRTSPSDQRGARKRRHEKAISKYEQDQIDVRHRARMLRLWPAPKWASRKGIVEM